MSLSSASSVPTQAESVVSFPGRPDWSMVVQVALAQAAILAREKNAINGGDKKRISSPSYLFPNARETASFPTFVHRLRDPVDTWIASDLSRGKLFRSKSRKRQSTMNAHRLVVRVNKDDLVVLVHAILIHPVRIQHSKVPAPPADPLLRDAPESALRLDVVDALAHRLAVRRAYHPRTRISSQPRIAVDRQHPPLCTCFLRLPRRTRTR